MAQINVVPYIDVTLVLLIIFMITAPLLTRGVKVDLPHANAKPLSQKEMEQHQPIVLTVDKTGRYYMNIGEHPDKPVTPNMVIAMTQTVLKRSPKTPVLIRGDAGVNYDAVMHGMVLLQKAGVANIGLITNPKNNPQIHVQGKP